MPSANRPLIGILVVTALAVAFWMLLLGPKREKAHELSSQADSLQVSLTEAQSRATEATAAKQEFPADYKQLVLLGQAVPANDETSSLLVELNQVAADSNVSFDTFSLNATGEGVPEVAPAPAVPPATEAPGGSVPAAATVPPTEAAASLLPLGATIGPAGLGVMPYRLTFSGTFFEVADFIHEIDSLVETKSTKVSVQGRLVTLDGFALNADPELEFPHLDASFAVTTFVTPPDQGLTAGASPTAPAPEAPAAEEEAPAAEATQTAAAQ
ncbi:MAG TPA: type 4a pilus biogenesis protein PilO [Solirubrobacterales bacterium]|nr:type 4a pilus biogenesis protein PilO [Solirubrobacterales bacterium]